jgi:hypothetical protein
MQAGISGGIIFAYHFAGKKVARKGEVLHRFPHMEWANQSEIN